MIIFVHLKFLSDCLLPVFSIFQRESDPRGLPEPAAGGDGLPTDHAVTLSADLCGGGRKVRPAEPGTQHQPHRYRTPGT